MAPPLVSKKEEEEKKWTEMLSAFLNQPKVQDIDFQTR